MENSKVIFIFNGIDETIYCSKEDKMGYICQKYATQINKYLNSLLFFYGKDKVNFELSFYSHANFRDRNNNEMRVYVYENEEDKKNELNKETINEIIINNKKMEYAIKDIKFQIENLKKNSLM